MDIPAYARLKILIVDDFDSFRQTLGRMLADLGCHNVSTVMNGRLAVEACRKQRFDVVLCDYNLGSGPNGQQVLEELRVKQLLPRQSLFFLVSAEASQAIVLSAFDYAPDAYLTKPITGKSLQQRLERLLRQRQEMLPVYRCLDAGDAAGAMARAEELVANGSRYAMACQRLLGELYLEHERIEDAERLYTRVLEVRPLDWAQVGLSRVRQRQGDYDTAGRWLESILADNRFCLEAYDALADNYLQQGDMEQRQEVMERAVEVSPLSLLRQEQLASTATNNRDLPVASRAWGRCVKLGENSCRGRSQYHLQYGRYTAAWLQEAPPDNARELIRDSLRVMTLLPKRFSLSQDQRQQASLVECQLFKAQGNEQQARAQLLQVEEHLHDDSVSLEVQLDRLAAHKSLGHDQQLSELLELLVERYRDDEEALQRIDPWLAQPLSRVNRRRVVALNREGIGLYEAGDFEAAIARLRRAWRLFPNHLGVQLNLLQAQVAHCAAQKQPLPQMCRDLLGRLESAVKPGSDAHNRLRQIQQTCRDLG